MQPTLQPDDYVLCWRWLSTTFNINDLIVTNHHTYHIIVKRIVDFDHKRGYLLAGDNPASTPSNQLGWVQKKDILGKIVKVI